MAATTAEGEGNRFIAIAVETSEPVPVNRPADNCKKVGFAGGGRARRSSRSSRRRRSTACRRWAPIACCRRSVDGKLRTGEVYNYIASFGTFLVIVTANPLVLPDKPVAPVDTQRARDLLTAAVAAVEGLADVVRAELDADPWAGRPRRLRYRVLPGALAGAAHHQQVAVPVLQAQ